MAFEFLSGAPGLYVLAAFAVCIPTAFAQQFPLVDIQVTGAVRLPATAVISASGLAVGRTVTAKDFDAAVARLDETGLFASLAYRYDSKTAGGKSGMALVLQVTEAPVAGAVRLDFSGVNEQQLWQEIKRENGLVEAQIPGDQQAVVYYKEAIKAAPCAAESRSGRSFQKRGRAENR
jgi:outer membrane protein assembly factor BamA